MKSSHFRDENTQGCWNIFTEQYEKSGLLILSVPFYHVLDEGGAHHCFPVLKTETELGFQVVKSTIWNSK